MVSTYISEHILELPLFQGLSRSDLPDIFAEVKPVHTPCSRGRIITFEGYLCDRLYFIVEGRVQVMCEADDHSYKLKEYLNGPDVIQPERVFGLTPRFTRVVTAASNCEIMSISKAEVLLLAAKYDIFRLNLLNIISTWAQRMSRYAWKTKPENIRGKLFRFIEERSLRPAGKKHLLTTIIRLSQLIEENRIKVTKELKAMNDEGMITLCRGEIIVPALEKVI